MKTTWIAGGSLALTCALATPAFAQTSVNEPPQPGSLAPPPATPLESVSGPRDVAAKRLRAPTQALELGVDIGYTQGFGRISGRRGVEAVAGAGGRVGASLGYRIDPHWSVAATGRYEGYAVGTSTSRSSSVRGATAGFEATLHTRPYERLDPYFSMGAGYRALMESPSGAGPTIVTHGFELGRVQFGLDLRASDDIAVSPVIGADLNLFTWRTGGGETADLTSRKVNTFIFAGVEGRFDLGGSRQNRPQVEEMGRR